jgi:hypothetical protein
MIRANLVKSALIAVALTLSFSAARAQAPIVNSTNSPVAVSPSMYYGMPYVGQVSGVYGGYSAISLGAAPLGSPFGIPFGFLAGAPIGVPYVSGFSGPPPGYYNGYPENGVYGPGYGNTASTDEYGYPANGDYGPGYGNTAITGEPGAPPEGNGYGNSGNAYDDNGNEAANNGNAAWGNETNASAGRNMVRQNPIVVRPAPYGRVDVIYRGSTADVSRITMMVLDKNRRELNESVLTGPPAQARLTRYTNAKYYRVMVDYKDGTTVTYTGPLSK